LHTESLIVLTQLDDVDIGTEEVDVVDNVVVGAAVAVELIAVVVVIIEVVLIDVELAEAVTT
jgi:hypothetical protein